jgi:uncharacterized protein YuzB (UPF0349 family)
MRGLVLIEVCGTNRACVPALFDLEAQFAGVSILENDCMSQCTLCDERAYVLMEGTEVSADDVPSLIEQLRHLCSDPEQT